MAIRVLLADDHRIIRDGLRLLFGQNTVVQLVGEAADGREAVDLADELRPDVVVMDVTMPFLDGPEATREILKRCPQTKVIALSMHCDRYYVDRMQAAGASGYVPKEEAYDVLQTALEAVHAGGTFFP
jgi:two-component system, NarL family, response regulator NreC